MSDLYEVRDWDELYETAETRKREKLNWVPVPNKHDGLGYRTMMNRADAAELFAAWNLILQVASKGKKGERGKLIRDNLPLNAGQLALVTGLPADLFERALKFFSSSESGWLVKTSINLPLDAGQAADDAASSGLNRRKEGNRKEENRKKGKEGAAPHARREIPSRSKWVEFANSIDLPEDSAQSAYDYYEANGWKQKGGNIIKDWEAACRTCKRFHNERNNPKQTTLTDDDYAQGF